MTGSGKTMHVPLTEVLSVAFTAVTAAPAAPAVSNAPPAEAARPAVIFRAGTPIRVRTADAIDADKSKTGMQFRATTDEPMMSGGAIAVPRGAAVTLVASNSSKAAA